MSADLLREDAGVHHAQPADAVHAALEVHDGVARILGPHARRAHRVVQREGALLHKGEELLVGDGVRVAARGRPPEAVRVVVGRDGLEELCKVRAAGNLEAQAEGSEQDFAVVVVGVAKVLGVDDGYKAKKCEQQ